MMLIPIYENIYFFLFPYNWHGQDFAISDITHSLPVPKASFWVLPTFLSYGPQCCVSFEFIIATQEPKNSWIINR